MPDYEFPHDLLELQLAYWASEAAAEKAAAALPSSVAMVAGTLTDEEQRKLPKQRKALTDARAERDKAFVALKAHGWWEQEDQRRDQYAAWRALQAAARELQKARQEDAKV
ncbi:hypothetical protein ACIBCT_21335 [Streptosporangium sp. NPDC050855]|uniref:hypothetical protein n=1 Tax=Streptosporangium sp. NPDC050855 TaxID=3366194 RepID=UPI0037951180